MNSHKSSVPTVAANYFGDGPHPMIHQVFVPGTGWRFYPGRKLVSVSAVRGLRRAGVTSVSLRVGTRIADFQVDELTRR